MYVSLIETDYSSRSEYVSIIVENDNLGNCDEFNDDCTYEVVDCLNGNGYNLGDHSDSVDGSSDEYFGVALASYGTNICAYNNMYFVLDKTQHQQYYLIHPSQGLVQHQLQMKLPYLLFQLWLPLKQVIQKLTVD